MASTGWPWAHDVRSVTSTPAAAQRLAISSMWTSEPPASTSSRSRQASAWTRRMPAEAARSPIFSTVRDSGSSKSALVTDGCPPPALPARRWVALGPEDPGAGWLVCYGTALPHTSDPRPKPSNLEHNVSIASPDLAGALDGVAGWFSPEQVDRVATRAAAAPPGGRIVEIGSFRGRSMIAIARSAPEGVELVAIDPHAGNDRGPQEIEGFEEEAAEDNVIFLRNLEKAGVADRVRHVRKFSHDAHHDVQGEIDVLHID